MSLVFPTMAVALAVLSAEQRPGVAGGTKETIPVWWAPNLALKDQADVDRALGAPFEDDNDFDVVLDGKAKRHFTTCRELLAVPPDTIRKLEDAGPTDWGILWAAVANCNAINLIKSAKPAKRSNLPWSTFSPKQLAKLPPLMADIDACGSSCPEDTRSLAKAIKTCQPWRKYDPSLKIKVRQPNAAEISTNGWTGDLTLYARGDFNGDELEDLLVVRNGQAVGGSLTDATVFILTQTSPKSCVEVVRALTFGHYP